MAPLSTLRRCSRVSVSGLTVDLIAPLPKRGDRSVYPLLIVLPFTSHNLPGCLLIPSSRAVDTAPTTDIPAAPCTRTTTIAALVIEPRPAHGDLGPQPGEPPGIGSSEAARCAGYDR